MKKNNFFLMYIPMLIVCFFLGFCSKKEISLANDNCYIVDSNHILMLCKEGTNGNYTNLISQLKGNKTQVEACIVELKKLDDSAEIKNAIAVGYINLREQEVAIAILQEALMQATEDEQKMCIFSNLAAANGWIQDYERVQEYLNKASAYSAEDPIRQLVMESNVLRGETVEDYSKAIKEIKELLRREKELLGSNQFIGIYNYTTIGLVYDLKGDIKNSEKYFKKAIKLNNSTHKYPLLGANLYNCLSYTNSYRNKTKALKYINEEIKILYQWQDSDHADVMLAYHARGNIYLSQMKVDAAINNYVTAMNLSELYSEITAVSYYNIGYAYMQTINSNAAIDNFVKAYYIWSCIGNDGGSMLDIKGMVQGLYDKKELDTEFEIWFDDKVKRAEKELAERKE